MAKSAEGTKVLGVNKKARYNYAIDETFEAGLVLVGTEVKSIKEGRFSFADSYAQVDKDELWLIVREELKSEPHVRALTDFLASYIRDAFARAE